MSTGKITGVCVTMIPSRRRRRQHIARYNHQILHPEVQRGRRRRVFPKKRKTPTTSDLKPLIFEVRTTSTSAKPHRMQNLLVGLINSDPVSVLAQPTASVSTIALSAVYGWLPLLPLFDRLGLTLAMLRCPFRSIRPNSPSGVLTLRVRAMSSLVRTEYLPPGHH